MTSRPRTTRCDSGRQTQDARMPLRSTRDVLPQAAMLSWAHAVSCLVATAPRRTRHHCYSNGSSRDHKRSSLHHLHVRHQWQRACRIIEMTPQRVLCGRRQKCIQDALACAQHSDVCSCTKIEAQCWQKAGCSLPGVSVAFPCPSDDVRPPHAKGFFLPPCSHALTDNAVHYSVRGVPAVREAVPSAYWMPV